jgi:ribonuclease T2
MIRRIVSIFFVLLIATPVWSQAKGELRGGEAGAFEYYVLALSWSPSFCHDIGEKRGLEQCRPGAKNDFVVHGLWPQNRVGYPTECQTEQKELPKSSFEAAVTVFPDLKLAEHEWQRHGSCTARTPEGYLSDTAMARKKVVIPEIFRRATSEASYSPSEIEKAFLTSNPGLEGDMINVGCSRGELQEVRICFSKALDGFRHCPELQNEACRAKNIRVLAEP